MSNLAVVYKPRVSKPEGFPTFFGKGSDCVAHPFGMFVVGASTRPRKDKSGKSQGISGR